MENSTVVKKTPRGVYYVELPPNFLRITKWKEGDTLEVMVGGAASIKKDDLILRKVP